MMGDGWGWIGGGLMMMIFWGGFIVLVVFAARGFGSRPYQRRDESRAPDAKEILAERFARGEISEEEFEARGHVLERKAS